MNKFILKYRLSFLVAVITFALIVFAESKSKLTLLMLVRFFPDWGLFVQAFIMAIYSFVIFYFLNNPSTFIKTKILIWSIFSIVFFLQLIIGMCINDTFLMTGKLHLPIPMMIFGGSLYRLDFGFMPILLLSTILLSGPAWCSYLCYFGVFDYLSSKPNTKPKMYLLSTIWKYKFVILFLIIFVVVFLRIFQVNYFWSLIVASSFGVIGLSIILIITRKKRFMFHCTRFCPIHTLIVLTKWINPYKIYIDKSMCNKCLKCIHVCKYNSLNYLSLDKGKPNLFCTNCLDCYIVCNDNAIKMRFWRIKKDWIQSSYLIIVTVLHSVFLAFARI